MTWRVTQIAWKVSKYGPEKPPYLDTIYVVSFISATIERLVEWVVWLFLCTQSRVNWRMIFGNFSPLFIQK